MKNQWWVVVYYLILMSILLSWGNTSAAPPILFRVLFFIAVAIPAFLRRVPLLLAFSVFLTITLYGNSYSYMPTSLSLYVILAIVYYLFITVTSTGFTFRLSQKSLLFLLILSFIINALRGGDVKNITWSLLLICLLTPLLDQKDSVTARLFPSSFIIISLVLSGLFLAIGEQYTEAYDIQEGLERSGWVDPNYFSSIIGMGAIIALCEIMSSKKPVLILLLLIVALLLSVYTMVSIASRGALLAFSAAVTVILLASRIKPIPKLFIVGIIALFIYWMYSSSTFDLLLYRISNDSNGGSGRTKIWSSKMDAFLRNGTLLDYLFGFGYENTMDMGTSTRKGVHNDYLAFLFEYGLCGAALFLSTLISPLLKTTERKNRPIVLSLTVYLAVCVLTLEPMSLGILVFYVFYSYIDYLSRSKVREL